MDILISKMNRGQVFRGLMIVNEKANPNYNIDFIKRFTPFKVRIRLSNVST